MLPTLPTVKLSAKTPVSCYVSWHTSSNGVITHVGNPASGGANLKYEFKTLKDTIFFFLWAGRKRTRKRTFTSKPTCQMENCAKMKSFKIFQIPLRLGFTVHSGVHGAIMNSHYQWSEYERELETKWFPKLPFFKCFSHQHFIHIPSPA
jgi:hypothetical protein